MSSGARPKTVKRKVNVPSRYKQTSEKGSYLSSRDTTSKEVTQDISGLSQSSQGVTSTPTSEGAFPFPLLDASAVTESRVPLLKERIVPKPTGSGKRNQRKQKALNESQLPVTATCKEKKRNDSFDEELASAEMDILYAEYLQSAFLLSEAKKTLKARSAAATGTLHKLLNLIQHYLHKAKSQKALLEVLSSLIEVHEHCHKQDEMLKPVLGIIPVLEKQYRSLAEAVGAAKHKLHVKDVLIPDTDSDEIHAILQKMKDFMSEFFEAVPNREDIILSANVMKSYVDSCELLTDALKRGVNLLTEAEETYVSEAFLALVAEDVSQNEISL